MSLAVAYGMKKKKMAHGGAVEQPMAAKGGDDLVDRIMKARGCYSEGGMIANETEPLADSEENEFDDLVLRDDLEADYVHPNDGPGNEQQNQDREDVVSRIMRSRKMKDRNPVPA